MPPRTLTSAQVQAIIDSVGTGASYTQRLRNVAAQIGTSSRTMWRFQTFGASQGPLNAALHLLAEKNGVVLIAPPPNVHTY